MIPSPYYFIPFGEQEPEVFLPPHADVVSQDHPFSDGMSGHLEIELEATTPIYIRNAGDHRDYKDSGELLTDLDALLRKYPSPGQMPVNALGTTPKLAAYAGFYQVDNKYAIPGTSLKGPIRTLMQILTRGRCEPVNNRRYSMRDLHSVDYKSWFRGGVNAGFVRWRPEQGHHQLIPCKHATILQTELETFALEKGAQLSLGSPQKAQDKYDQWLKQKLPYSISCHVLDDEAHLQTKDGSKKIMGTPVFVGQLTERDKNENAKKKECIFYDLDEAKAVIISEDVWQGFLDAHEDTNRVPSDSWAYWKSQLQSNPEVMMPVFYLAHETGTEMASGTCKCLLTHPNAKLHSIGLSRMYRLPHRLSLHDAIPAAHRPPHEDESEETLGENVGHPDHAPDFASLMFGEALPRRHLKGRISFDHLFCTQSPGPMRPVIAVLGGPNPGYYPNYMKGGRTLMQKGASLRGWKMYASRPDGHSPVVPTLPGGEANNLKVCTVFQPLAKGTRFKGKVRFHNLRPFELGALLWTLTWGGREQCRHRLGMAKPLGYGCAKIGIAGGELIPNASAPTSTPARIDASQVKCLVGNFEKWLAEQPSMRGWLDGVAVRTLLDLVRQDHGVSQDQLRYPVLNPDTGVNEFNAAKKGRQTLPEWLDLPRGPRPDNFTFWPDWMLPKTLQNTRTDEFPGGDQLGAALFDTSEMQEMQWYRCIVTSKNPQRRRIYLQVVGGDDTTQGQLQLFGPAVAYFDLVAEGDVIAVVYKSGGPRNRIYQPVT